MLYRVFALLLLLLVRSNLSLLASLEKVLGRLFSAPFTAWSVRLCWKKSELSVVEILPIGIF